MADAMIDIREATMDFHLEHENINSFKEFFVNLLKGKIHYDHFRAVDHVNLQVKPGEVCGIIGRNGAGKSTLLKMIAGVLTPTGGSIKIHGNIAPMLELGAGRSTSSYWMERILPLWRSRPAARTIWCVRRRPWGQPSAANS